MRARGTRHKSAECVLQKMMIGVVTFVLLQQMMTTDTFRASSCCWMPLPMFDHGSDRKLLHAFKQLQTGKDAAVAFVLSEPGNISELKDSQM